MTHADNLSEQAQRPTVLLVNLGTPDDATPQAVRSFLRAFLTDPRVIEYPQILWRPILEAIILRIRPAKVAKAYKKIWTSTGSPLMAGTLAQTHALREVLGADADVRHAMCYGTGNLNQALTTLAKEGAQNVLILPAYPQYSASTVGAVYDIVAKWILRNRNQMNIRLIRSWQDAPEYIEALATAIEKHWEKHGKPNFDNGDTLIASYHSIPMAMKTKGDPYHDECEHTTALLRARLGLNDTQLKATYQSVFGPAEWIGPATIDTIENLGKNHTQRIDVICPGFVADCLETLEEIGIQNRDAFLAAGGTQFHYIPWANGEPACVNALAAQARAHLNGW